ncbi:MAG: sodium/proline symporter [Gammaproteobacteria bacterium]|nr:sodium/proline symporter [Gammaproteobacteria bacterium]MCY4340139.1 sodium/proline symporter [Gammaproteobacteria bacterium]
MNSSTTVIVTLIAYNLILLGMGLWARRRTRDQGDFLLGGRRIGAWLTSLSASASTTSAWTLLGISGFAYALGPPGLWLALGAVFGYVLSWCWVAPRLNRAAERTGALTLTELLLGGDDTWARLARRAASIIILICFTFYVASQFQAAANAFGESLGISAQSGILLGAGVILAYTLLGGFLAVSLTDSLQGLLMLLASLLLAGTMMFAVIVISGTNNMFSVTGEPFSLAPPQTGLAAAGFLIGSLCVGLGQPGQPHVANRFMAARDQRAVRRGRIIALAWVVLVFAGMAVLGMAGRVLYSDIANPENLFFVATERLLPPVLSGIVIAAVLSAIMSTADSQLLTGAAAVSRDWSLERARKAAGLKATYAAVIAITAGAALIALFAPQSVFLRVLFAWHALGASFAPLVYMAVLGRQVKSAYALAVLVLGFMLTVILHWQPDTPGDWAERLVPIMVTLAIAIAGSRRMANARE